MCSPRRSSLEALLLGIDDEAAAPIDRDIRFGPFCLRPAAHLLLEGDRPIHIGGRALDLLMVLVERAGEIVTKDELFARVWPGLTVDEGNLRTQIALVRKALRDDQSRSRYVMTIPGRGYRFVARVSPAEITIPSEQPIHLESPSGLPARLTRLIGRADAVGDIVERLDKHRFVTVLGPGGIGKTSVALAVAEQAAPSYGDGVCIVDCAPLLGTSLVARKLASTLGLEIAVEDPTRGLVAFLHRKRMLIVLDCCERVVEDAAVLVESLLRGATGVGILATSREPLRAEGEIVYRLPPLEIPPASNDLTANDALNFPAVQLFIERAASNLGQFELNDDDAPVVADICRKLDGIALAIELAAGRVDVFGLSGIAARLEDQVRLLTHGRRTALPRHQTLGAMLDWSYDALADSEQRVLRRLSVFAGRFTLAAAEAIAADDLVVSSEIVELVASLVSKSLVNADVRGAFSQYRLLDTTRAYAQKKLTESDEFDQTARRHALYVHSLLDKASADAAASSSIAAAATLSAESELVDEARTVIDWAFSTGGDIETGIALTAASVPLWTHLSLNGECCRYVEQALLAGRPVFGENDRREMQLLAALGGALVWTKGPGPEADLAFKSALKIADALKDTDYQIRLLWGLWSSHFNSGRIRISLETARQFRDVAINHGDRAAALVGERTVGMSLFYLGDHDNARQHAETMLRHYFRPRDRSHIIRFQFDPRIVSRTLRTKLLWAQGFPDQAMHEAHGAVEEATNVAHAMSLALTLAQGACSVALLSGDLAAAEIFINRLLKHTVEHALGLWHAWGECFAAMLVVARGQTAEGLETLHRILDELPPGAFFANYAAIQATLAETLGKVGAISSGHAAIDGALMRSERDDERWYVAEFLRIKGELLRLENRPTAVPEAKEQFERSLDCARQQAALSWELRTSLSLARLYRAEGDIVAARGALEPVYSRFTEGFETADLTAAKTLLDALS
jgi:predicted ATPase/DNA-binding winged helix-turn-helix (wHTH) protein